MLYMIRVGASRIHGVYLEVIYYYSYRGPISQQTWGLFVYFPIVIPIECTRKYRYFMICPIQFPIKFLSKYPIKIH